MVEIMVVVSVHKKNRYWHKVVVVNKHSFLYVRIIIKRHRNYAVAGWYRKAEKLRLIGDMTSK